MTFVNICQHSNIGYQSLAENSDRLIDLTSIKLKFLQLLLFLRVYSRRRFA